MPAFRTFDRDRTMTLLYNSATAKPYSIVMADVSLAQGVSAPDRLDVSLIVNGVQQASHSFSAAGFASGGNARRLAVGFDPVTAGLATGAYSYTLHVTSVYGGQSFPVSKAGQLIVINRQSSPYGAGWAVAGVERLFAQSDGSRLLVDGDGSAWLYTSIGSNQWRAPAGAYRDTLFLGAVSNGSVPAGTYYWRYDLSGTRTFYDLDGRQVFVVDRLQNKVEYSYLPTGPEARLDKVVVAPHSAQHRYEFIYDGNGRLASINDPSGSRTLYTTINASNDLAAIRDPGYAVGKEIQFTYDSHRLKTRRSRRGHTTRYGYHNAYFGSTGVLRADTLPVAVVNQAFTPIQIRGLASQAAANSTVRSDSAFVTIRGVRNDTARFLVNSDYAPTLIIDPLSTVSTLAYDPNHPLLVTRVAQPEHGIVRRMGYDAIGRLSWLQDSTHSQGPARTDYIYGSQIRDNPSHVISDRTTTDRDTIRYFFDPSMGWADSVRDARGKSTRFAYFPNGKVQTITNALGKSTSFTYTGAANLETVTTPLGHVTEYTYDIYGQVRTQLAPATGLFTIYRGVRSNQPESTAFVSATYGNLTTQFTYDDDGNLITRVDPTNIARQWEYDPLGNIKKMTDESGHAENRVHTADGLPLIITNRDGSQVLQDYNAAGQVTMRYLHPAPNYGGPYDEIEMEYDALGRIERIENTNSRITRTYRPEGTLATEEQYLKFSEANGKTFKYEYIYNKGGARTQAKIFINGVLQRTITYSRGKDNLLGGMTWGAHSLSIGYDDLGRRATLSFPGGINVSLSYDDDGRFTRLLTASLDLEFTSFDGAGRPLSATRTGNTSILWTYDLQGQITSMTDLGVTASYVYDKAGNRIRESLNGTPYLYTYFPGTNRLQKRCEATSNWLCKTSGQWQQYAYNANGDITTKQTHNGLNIPFFRTADGQITSHYALATQFRYDGLGRLVMRRDGDTFNQTTGYDGVNVGWHNGAFFLHGDGVDDPLVTSTGGNCFFVTDNARLLAYLGGAGCDSNWDMMGRYAGAINQSWGFGLNREHEANSQLSFFRNRWYDAQTGRFTQEDPIGFAGGLNLYAYAGNNPASYTDPFGLCPPEWMCLLQRAGRNFTVVTSALLELGGSIRQSSPGFEKLSPERQFEIKNIQAGALPKTAKETSDEALKRMLLNPGSKFIRAVGGIGAGVQFLATPETAAASDKPCEKYACVVIPADPTKTSN
ncbi:MAG TPA: RHS repeat-associated core domain-containing protein [Anaerolineales bacterium]|nr:RHS repeat-associated core domain-containing protein [Anaerolineales bacterium]